VIDFVAIDFETANEKPGSICQIGVVTVENGEVTSKHSWLVRPSEFRFKRKCTEIHGIRRRDVKDKETFQELWPELSQFFSNRILVAHCAASADINHLREVLRCYEIEPPEFQYTCSCALARAAWPDSPGGFTLREVADYLGITYQPHDATEDAAASALTVLRACRDAEANSVEELSEKLGVDLVPFSMDAVRHQFRDYRENGISIEIGYDVDDWGHVEIESDDSETSPLDGFTEKHIHLRCKNAGEFQRGLQVFQSGKVDVTNRDDLSWTALIEGSGSEPYEVEVDRSLQASCPCRAFALSRDGFCKHAAALALAWASDGGPRPIDNLSVEGRQRVIYSTLEQLPDSTCKQILLDIAEREPETIRRLIFDESAEENKE